MSENDIEEMQNDVDLDDEQVDDEFEDESDVEEPSKPAKRGKSGKKSARSSAKESARLKKEWEDSIVASKKVKREEMRNKVKRAMLIMLVFALIVTSVVYIMLLFIEENSVRITVSNINKDKSITLSMDNEYWTPYLYTNGPNDITNISYDTRYTQCEEFAPSLDEVKALLNADDIKLGEMNGTNYIWFTFMLRNNGNEDAHIDYEMTLEFDKHNLQNAVRVMWAQRFRDAGECEDPVVYAALSNNERLAGTSAQDKGDGIYRTAEEGYVEYVTYPGAVDGARDPQDKYYNISSYEQTLDSDEKKVAESYGFIKTTPFASDEYVFQNSAELSKGDIMYVSVCIWLEGSDFDCIDEVIGGYCKMGINFYAS